MGTTWAAINNGLPENAGVQTLAIDPTNPSTLYAGTDGGVFTSSDMGANWVALNNGLTTLGVLALAIDPSDPSTLYAGTAGGGVFKSTDMGADWVAINSGLTNTFLHVLAIDPTNTSTLYSGTAGGVFRSTDMGANWTGVNNGLIDETGVRALVLDPANPSTLYAGTLGSGVFRSTDMGANWVAINSGLNSTLVISLAVDPVDTSTLYAGTAGGVFKSTDMGANWQSINNGLANLNTFALAIDPTDPSTLYAGGVDFGGVFKSTDMGANWTAINNGLTNTYVFALVIDPTNTSTVYAGTRGAVFYLTPGPRWFYAAGNPAGIEAQFDALALTNFSDSEANLDLEIITSTAANASVQLNSPQGNGNQASLILQSGEQTARLRTDLFEGDPAQPAWIELTSDTSEIGTFFQFGTGTLSQLDGGVAITQTSTHIVLTRIFDGSEAFRGQPATTRVSILNPNQDPVTIELNYRPLASAAGSQGTSTVTRTIPGRSFLDERAADLFGFSPSGSPLGDQLPGGVIAGEVTEGDGVVAFEVIQLTDQSTVLGLNAATGNSTNRAYSAQLASLPGLFTSVNVVNLADVPRNVTLRAVQEDGSDQGDPVMIVLDPGEQFTEDAGVLFGTAAAGASPAQGGGLRGFADRGSGWRWSGGRCDLRRLSRFCLCGFAAAANAGFHRGPLQPGGECLRVLYRPGLLLSRIGRRRLTAGTPAGYRDHDSGFPARW